jgi:hypothetical protein
MRLGLRFSLRVVGALEQGWRNSRGTKGVNFSVTRVLINYP